jgi:hypothetical protein
VSTTAIIWTAATAAGFPLLLWAIGRAVTSIGARVAAASVLPHQYRAGRLYAVRITTVVAFDGELLVSLATQAGSPLAGVFRVTAAGTSWPGSCAGERRGRRFAPASAGTETSRSPIPHPAATPDPDRSSRSPHTPANGAAADKELNRVAYSPRSMRRLRACWPVYQPVAQYPGGGGAAVSFWHESAYDAHAWCWAIRRSEIPTNL